MTRMAKREVAATTKRFVEKLKTHRSRAELLKYGRYFRFSNGKPLRGDKFIGVRMGQVFALAKEFVDMSPNELERLLERKIHEVRAGGLSIMAKQASARKTSQERLKELYDLYEAARSDK